MNSSIINSVYSIDWADQKDFQNSPLSQFMQFTSDDNNDLYNKHEWKITMRM